MTDNPKRVEVMSLGWTGWVLDPVINTIARNPIGSVMGTGTSLGNVEPL